MVSAPTQVGVRMYQVGFGDCILVSVGYDEPLSDGRAERHILIDFGSTRSAREGRARGRMSDVAKLIEEHTGGELDVLVVTHRHKDHLAGFADDSAAKVLRALAPKRVLRSWTEVPDRDGTADGQPDAETPKQDGLGRASIRYAQLLSDAQKDAEVLSTLTGLHDDVQAAAKEQVKNAKAIELLDELAASGRGRYLHAGADAGLDDLIPGLAVTVLGPPTVEQDARVAKQREEDREYWMLALRSSLREAAQRRIPPGEKHDIDLGPGPVRWLIERLSSQKSHSVARLVRDLDDALNNTSLVLLLEIGELKMLFAGDAQIENWQYTLERLDGQPRLKAKLAAIDLYKVGHHGSRNATPRTLHALWKDRPDDSPKMIALMSTREGVHGKSVATAVPRETLVTALRQVATLHSTDDLGRGEEFIELVADVGQGPFRLVQR